LDEYPGASALTLIPCGASSTAILLERWATAAFEALYAACGCGLLTIWEDILEIMMILPGVEVEIMCFATA
jgi:hypothetical protein